MSGWHVRVPAAEWDAMVERLRQAPGGLTRDEAARDYLRLTEDWHTEAPSYAALANRWGWSGKTRVARLVSKVRNDSGTEAERRRNGTGTEAVRPMPVEPGKDEPTRNDSGTEAERRRNGTGTEAVRVPAKAPEEPKGSAVHKRKKEEGRRKKTSLPLGGVAPPNSKAKAGHIAVWCEEFKAAIGTDYRLHGRDFTAMRGLQSVFPTEDEFRAGVRRYLVAERSGSAGSWGAFPFDKAPSPWKMEREAMSYRVSPGSSGAGGSGAAGWTAVRKVMSATASDDPKVWRPMLEEAGVSMRVFDDVVVHLARLRRMSTRQLDEKGREFMAALREGA